MTRVCLATEGEQLSVECGLEKCVTTALSPAAAMGTHVGGEIVRRIADTVTSIQPGTSGDTWTLTHTRTLMGPVPVGGICCGFFSLHLMFLANNQMI